MQPQPDTHNTNSPLSPLFHNLLGVLHGPGLVLEPTGGAVQSQHVSEVADLSPPSPHLSQSSAVSERNEVRLVYSSSEISMLLTPALLCHKDTARAQKESIIGAPMPLCVFMA